MIGGDIYILPKVSGVIGGNIYIYILPKVSGMIGGDIYMYIYCQSFLV